MGRDADCRSVETWREYGPDIVEGFQIIFLAVISCGRVPRINGDQMRSELVCSRFELIAEFLAIEAQTERRWWRN